MSDFSNSRLLPFPLILSFILSPTSVAASPIASPQPISLPSWLVAALPEKGDTLADEIKCYGLPYGGVGNASHILTYWTLGCLFFYRRPWMPWSKLHAGKIDLALGIIQLLASGAVASFTIIRCQSRWQFVLLAVGRLQNSLTLGYCAIHTSLKIIHDKSETHKRLSALPYMIHFAALPGLVGLASLIANLWQACECKDQDACNVCLDWPWGYNPPIQIISYVFFAAVAVLVIALLYCMLRRCSSRRNVKAYVFHIICGLISLFLALWTDWILAAIADNLVGVPSGDVAILYWVRLKKAPLAKSSLTSDRRILEPNDCPFSFHNCIALGPVCSYGYRDVLCSSFIPPS